MWKVISCWMLLICGMVSCAEKPHLSFEENGADTSDGYDTDDEFEVKIVSVDYLKSFYEGVPRLITEEVAIRGRVIENDFSGNFHEMLVIGDGTANIEVRAAGSEMFADYPRGSVVTAYCQGLILAADGGMVRLGAKPQDVNSQYAMEAIAAGDVAWRIRKTEDPIQEVLPDDTLTISGLSPHWLGRLVGFEEVQFIGEELGLCWAEKDMDTNRHLVDRQGDTLIVRTSRYADFVSVLLPTGSGYIEGVVEYFNGTYQLRMGNDAYAVLCAPRFQVANP